MRNLMTCHANVGQTLQRAVAAMLGVLLAGGMFLAPARPAWAQAWNRQAADTIVDVAFDEAPLAKVFQSLADAAGLNILIDPSVVGKVSFTLRDVSVQEAIDLITRVTGHQYQMIGNTLVIGTAERLKPTPAAMAVDMFSLSYVAPAEAATLLAQFYPNVTFVPDENRDVLIVQGTADELAAVRDFLAQYDQRHAKPLHFRNESVETILWRLADRAGWNLVVEGTLRGEMTAMLEGMEYGQALALIADAAGLRHRFDGDVLYVVQPPPPSERPPMRRIAIHRLDHVNPVKTAEVLAEMYPSAHVDVDEESRTLIVEGDDAVLAAIGQFVEEMDAPRRQVIVEARLEEIDVRALRELGLDWDEGRGVVAATGMNPLVLAWSPAELKAELDALNSEGLSKVLASPKLAAIDGEAATIMIGERIPLILKTALDEDRVAETLEWIEAGIKLEILPHISADGAVTLNIETEISGIVGTEGDVPEKIRTREMSTRVRVQDGQSLVIGGLIQETEDESLVGLPLLGDLPLLGRLFSTKKTDTVQTEMVIFLIPHIVHDTPPAPTAAQASAASGQDAPSLLSPSKPTANPALQPVGSVVAARREAPSGVAEEGDKRAAARVSTAWLDVTSHMMGAYDVQFEKRKENSGYLTGVYVSSTGSGLAYGGNVGVRRYGSEFGGVTPWAGLGVEYLAPAGGDEPGYVLSARVGLGTREAAPLRIEVYGQYSIVDGRLRLPTDDAPARWDGVRAGLRFGWEY